MGCGLTKMNDSELVSLCRERKALIKASRDCRYAMAVAHISYFQSLLDVGNALNKFVEEELVITNDPASNAGSDHQSSEDGSLLEISSSESDAEEVSLTDYVHDGSELSEHSTSENDSGPEVNLNVNHSKKSSIEVPTTVYEKPQSVSAGVQLQHSSESSTRQPQHGNASGSMNFNPYNLRPHQYENGASFNGNMNFAYSNLRFPPQYGNGAPLGGSMHFLPNDFGFAHHGNWVLVDGPMNFPTNNLRFPRFGNIVSPSGQINFPLNNLRFSHHENLVSVRGPTNLPSNNLSFKWYGNEASFGGPTDAPIDPRFPQFGNGVLKNFPMDFSANDPDYNQTYIRPYAPSSPPPPEAVTWDYLNPFILVDDTFPNHYFQRGYETDFSSYGPDLSEVREREGIPDLEDENDQNLVEEALSEIDLEVNSSDNSDEVPSDAASVTDGEEIHLAHENEIENKHDAFISPENEIKSGNHDAGKDTKRKSDSFISNSSSVSPKNEIRSGTHDTGKDTERKCDSFISNGSSISPTNEDKSGTHDTGKDTERKTDAFISNGSSISPENEIKSGTHDTGKDTERKSDSFITNGSSISPENEIKSGTHDTGKDTERKFDSFISNGLSDEERKKLDILQEQEAFTHEGESSKQVSLTTLTKGSRDLKEAMKEIRDATETAFNHGKEVSVMLEAGKLPYQPTGTIFKVFSSWIPSLIAPSMVLSSLPNHMTLKQSASQTLKMVKTNNWNLEKDICMNSGNLSLTFEKLYVWEKKLYEEVKDEEKLRVIYVKMCRKLKALDIKGAEPSKIDPIQAAVKRLLPKINVAISTVDVISRRIHNLRDEELQPQLNEMVHGLIGMWKSIVECHKRQFQAIMEAKIRVQMTDTCPVRNSSLNATRKLEMEMLNWSASFSAWINTQKMFVKLLNGWLEKCLLEEPEETPDGIAPTGKLVAPKVFVVCNDWYHAIEKISETGVSKAILDFASMLHQLWKKLNEEKQQRLKAEYLSKDLEKRFKSLCEESGVNWDQYVLSFNNLATSGNATESGVPVLDGVLEELIPISNRLSEEKLKHEDAVKQVNDVAYQTFQVGLVPIFEALNNFSLEMSKAFEQIRIGNDDGSTK